MKNYTIKTEKFAVVEGKLTTVSEEIVTVQAANVWEAFKMVEGDSKDCIAVSEISNEPEPVEIEAATEETTCFEVAPVTETEIAETVALATEKMKAVETMYFETLAYIKRKKYGVWHAAPSRPLTDEQKLYYYYQF